MGDKSDEAAFEAHDQYPENPTAAIPLINSTSRTRSPTPPEIPQPESVEVPVESLEIQEDETNDNLPIHTCHNIPEHILAVVEAKEPEIHDSDVLDLKKVQNTSDLDVVQPPSIINTCLIDESLSPVHQSQRTGESVLTKPSKKLQFFENVKVTNMV